VSVTGTLQAQAPKCAPGQLDMQSTQTAMKAVESVSYPEITRVRMKLGTFHSRNDFFRIRFSILRFLLPVPMQYSVQVNPDFFTKQPPAEGMCAILAHELAHVVSLSQGNRLRRLGLVKLISGSYTAAFERKTDLEAIHRGYADGLKQYRAWVYLNIPADKVAEKRRRYFSPEEIDAVERRLQQQPELLEYWRQHPPRNLGEVNENSR
jgi:hypothetical protein